MKTIPILSPGRKFFLLPGMGASSRMYQGVWREVPDFHFLDWPDYQGEKTLADVADRLISAHGITAADEIGGSSLGGMVALEIFKKLGNPRVVLLGSAMQPQEVHRLLRFFAPLSDFVPFRVLQTVVKRSRRSLLEMYAAADAHFVRAMCRAVMDWPGLVDAPCNLLRIHGEKDRIIPCPAAAHVIKGAGHWLAMTHAEACLDFITKARLGNLP